MDPTTKARPRVVNGRAYTPKRTKESEREIALLLIEAGAKPNLFDDLYVILAFRTRTRQRRDIDNLVKLFLDAANGVLWHDDVQITKLEVTVIRGDDNPGVDVTVGVAQRRRKECVACGKEVTIRQSRLNFAYCSLSCYGVTQRGKRFYGDKDGGSCGICGKKLNDKRSVRCRKCWRKDRSQSAKVKP